MSACDRMGVVPNGNGAYVPFSGSNTGSGNYRRMEIALPVETLNRIDTVPSLCEAILELHLRLRKIEERKILVDGHLVPLMELIESPAKLELVLRGIG